MRLMPLTLLWLSGCFNKLPPLPKEAEPLEEYLDSHDVFISAGTDKKSSGTSLDFYSAANDDSENPDFLNAVIGACNRGWTVEKLKEAERNFKSKGDINFAVSFLDPGPDGYTIGLPDFNQQGLKVFSGINASYSADHYKDEKVLHYVARHESIHQVLRRVSPELADNENYVKNFHDWISSLYGSEEWLHPHGIVDFSTTLFPVEGEDAFRSTYMLEESLVASFYALNFNDEIEAYYLIDQFNLGQCLSDYKEKKIGLNEMLWDASCTYNIAMVLNRYQDALKIKADVVEAIKKTTPEFGAVAEQIFEYPTRVMSNLNNLLNTNSRFRSVYFKPGSEAGRG